MTRVRVAVAIVVVVATAAVVVVLRPARRVTARGAADVPTGTATVARTDLATTTQEAGTLEFPPLGAVVDQGAGTAFTALPATGTVLARGSTAFEVDGVGVPVFFGSRPMWRDLGVGVTPGPDVAELNENLEALGATSAGSPQPPDAFTWLTRAAVEAWQRARGVPATGVVRVGDVVYVAGPVRVGALHALLGAPATAGAAVFDATASTQAVDVALPIGDQYLVHVGDPVTITMPDGHSTTAGVVASLGTTAQAPDQNQNGSNGGGGSPAPNTGTSNTVPVTIWLLDARAAGTYTSAPVVVNVTSARVRQVLAVPVDALQALAEGGYAVTVVDGTARRLTRVDTGLFANDLVEVRGGGLAAGMRVEVPSS